LKKLTHWKGPREEETLATWIPRTMEKTMKERAWKGSTMASYMASLQGALAALPVYYIHTPPVILRTSPEWRLGLKGAGNLARSVLPSQAIIATAGIRHPTTLHHRQRPFPPKAGSTLPQERQQFRKGGRRKEYGFSQV